MTGSKRCVVFLLFFLSKGLYFKVKHSMFFVDFESQTLHSFCGHFKVKYSMYLWNKNINFHKNKTELKMENLKHIFREMNLMLQLVQELWIKSKTAMSWILEKKKRENVLSQLVYWIKFHNIHTFTYQKVLLHTLLLLVFKIL